jgi:hypothetical protein
MEGQAMTRSNARPQNVCVFLLFPGKDNCIAWLSSLLIVIAFGSAGTAVAAPCTTATPTCVEWISFQPRSERSLVYSTYPLTARNEHITRALILVHGGNRDAKNYFRTAVSAALLGGAFEDTVIVSPRFASNNGSCHDVLATNEINWDCGEGSSGGWRSGAAAISNVQLSSFDLTDRIVMKLAERSAFPNLKLITVAGFSAGGQYVNRYETANQVHENLGVPVAYVVGSPSSYAYPDALRPNPAGVTIGAFADASNCTTYDRWSYGLSGRAGYSSNLTNDEIQRQLISRPVTYLVGELETPQSPALDLACPAMAQGGSRLTRAQAFFKYITEKYGAKHRMVVVSQCGHNARCVLTADPVLPILFPKAE